jgi:transcription elongation factor Elf1
LEKRILHCKKCGREYSGRLLDGWKNADDWEFFCDCGGEMEFVKKTDNVIYL